MKSVRIEMPQEKGRDSKETYVLTHKTITHPRKRDEEVITLAKIFNSPEKNFKQELVEISSFSYSPKLLRKDDVFNAVYYSRKEEKLEALRQLEASYMDRFCEFAPAPDCPEERISKKIKELMNLIEDLDQD